jgi:hypothetical protein
MTTLSRVTLAIVILVLAGAPASGVRRAAMAETGMTIETYGAITIPREALPRGDVTVSFVHEIIPPGVSFDLPSGAPTRAADATVQLTGTALVTWGSKIYLVHPDGSEETIPAGTPAMIHAGDRFMVTDAVPAKTIAVVGTTPVEWLDLYLADGVYPEDPFWTTYRPPEEYQALVIGKLTPYQWLVSGLGAHDLSVTFRRITLPPGAATTVTPADPPVLRAVQTGQLTWSFTRTSPDPVSAHPVLCAPGTVIPWLPLEAGEEIQLTNGHSEPVELLEAVLHSVPNADSTT